MKKAVVLLILLTGSFAFANAQDSENYLQQGNTCFEQGDYDCAQNKYRLAKAMQNVSNIDELIKKAEECKKNFSDANAFFEKKHYEDARDSYRKVLDLNVKDDNAKRRYDLCTEELKKVKTVVPENVAQTNTNSSRQVKNTPQETRRKAPPVSGKEKSRFEPMSFLMPGVSMDQGEFADDYMFSFSLMGGYMPGRLGWYAKVKSDFAETYGLSAGVMAKCTNALLLYGGLGYAKTRISGFSLEFGQAVKIKKFMLAYGINYIVNDNPAMGLNLSLGMAF